MRLEFSTLQPTNSAGAAGGLISQWRVGAIVEAIAVRGADGQLWLNIGSQRVPARIASGDPSGPVNGEKLQLRVLRDSPVVALESVVANESDAAAVNEGLRRFLPRQSSAAPLLANLAYLADRTNAPTAIVKQVLDAAQRLWRALPDATELETPDGLAAALKRSGVFLENQLANGDAAELQQTATRDLKALLGSLKEALARNGAAGQRSSPATPGPLPTLRGALTALESTTATLANISSPSLAMSELANQADGALARINTLQLVNAEGAPNAAWLLELPIRRDGQPETLRFRFEREGRDPLTNESAWSIETAMDLGLSGALHARVSLQGKRVAVQLRTDSSELQTKLQTHSGELVDVLHDAGLQIDRVQCMHGMPSDRRELQSTQFLAKPLLDIRV